MVRSWTERQVNATPSPRHIYSLLACLVLTAALCIVAAASPQRAAASQLVARGVTHPSLRVNKHGVALVTYKRGKRRHHELYWGAKNKKLAFHVDRSGGWKSHKANWKKFKNVCHRVSKRSIQRYVPNKAQNESIPYVVAACRAPDKSYWVLQLTSAHQMDDFGGTKRRTRELRLSHFRGAVANLWVKMDWEYAGMWRHLYGQLKYLGTKWYGTKHDKYGASLDGRSRNIAIDAYDSDYPHTHGKWARVNAFLTNAPSGQFCFGFTPKFKSRAAVPKAFRKKFVLWRQAVRPFTGASLVQRYRASVPGPGVSPDVQISFSGWDPAKYESPDPTSQSGFRANAAGMALDAQANAEQHKLGAAGSCRKIN